MTDLRAPTQPLRNEPPRRMPDLPQQPRRAVATPAIPMKVEAHEGKRLTVGRDIALNGAITACDVLVVEGKVEASLTDCRSIEIAESGSFKGSAEIDSAEIAGRYDGELTVRDRLLVRGSGKISGKIRYGRLEVEIGGEVNGDVQVMARAAAVPQPTFGGLGPMSSPMSSPVSSAVSSQGISSSATSVPADDAAAD